MNHKLKVALIDILSIIVMVALLYFAMTYCPFFSTPPHAP